MLNESTFAIG